MQNEKSPGNSGAFHILASVNLTGASYVTTGMTTLLLPEIVLEAYTKGFFPMAEHKHGKIEWHNPDPRAVFPLHRLSMPRSVRQSIKKHDYTFSVNKAFRQVIEGCAARPETWISDEIIETYTELHERGYAHSVEAWQGGELAGGLYGMAFGRAFMGESMFNTMRDASKAAFYFLVGRLREKGFILLDTQYINPHTHSLGAVEISKSAYLQLLKQALASPVKFA